MPGPSLHGDRKALLALFFATVAVFADLYVTQPILPLLSREFGVPAPVCRGLNDCGLNGCGLNGCGLNVGWLNPG